MIVFVQVLFRQPFLDDTGSQQTAWPSVTECLTDTTQGKISFDSLCQTWLLTLHVTEELLLSRQKTGRDRKGTTLTDLLPLVRPT